QPLLCWLTPPNPGVVVELFARPVHGDAGSVACPPASLLAGLPAPALEPPDVQARRAAYARLVGAGRLVLSLDDQTLAGIPWDRSLPPVVRVVVAWIGNPDPRLETLVPHGGVTALRGASDPGPPVELGT